VQRLAKIVIKRPPSSKIQNHVFAQVRMGIITFDALSEFRAVDLKNVRMTPTANQQRTTKFAR